MSGVRRLKYKRRGAIAVPIVGRVRFGEKRYRREGIRVQNTGTEGTKNEMKGSGF